RRESLTMKSIFSVDVEDWFHILDTQGSPRLDQWDTYPSRLERNLLALLDILSQKRIHATCFVLGWVGERFPGLVAEIKQRGHEIGSHGYAHALVYQMTAEEFVQDARKSKAILEDVIGAPVMGYRAPGFSVTPQVPWFFEKLVEAGYLYDSSVFPARRAHGGMPTEQYSPHWVVTPSGRLFEFPVTVVRLLGMRLCLFGGGYLRMTPYSMMKSMARRVLADGRPVVYYIHPRDLDPDQPRLPIGPLRRFKSYVNLGSTAGKIARLVADEELTTFARYLAENGEQA
ncbi:MAG TPA: XrtA system polysaccharide deacetylase, partial [bacterium]|nr:XrtA system polysaccharide deacetylase [bacterium]